ncbi:MAG: ParA family protein [Hyphomonadaceae bacterium]|nr:ParA family protein [Hyphomonadaceae bacterium]
MNWRDILNDINLLWTTLGIALAGLSAAFAAGRWFGRLPIPALKIQIDDLEKRLEEAERQIVPTTPIDGKLLEKTQPESMQVWLADVDEANIEIANAEITPNVLLIANLKGGVAKTMLAANIAAHFARRAKYPSTSSHSSKRVLLIDLDYQGSLTGIMQAAMQFSTVPQKTTTATLFDEKIDNAEALQFRVHPSGRLNNLSFYPTEYGFDDFETRQQFQWLAGKTGTDVRFSLRNRLRSPEFRSQFDLIVIDTGPRLTTGAIGALAAATHLLVPTTIDGRSVEAAERFLRRVAVFKRKGVCPNLQVLGCVATLTSGLGGSPRMLSKAIQDFTRKVRSDDELRFLLEPEQAFLKATLPRNQTVVDETRASLPYLESTASRAIFNQIGLEIEERMSR